MNLNHIGWINRQADELRYGAFDHSSDMTLAFSD